MTNFAGALNKIRNGVSLLRKPPPLLKFIKHNRKVFSRRKPLPPEAPVVLFELNAMQSAHIAYGYMANALASRNDARILGYAQRLRQGVWQGFTFRLKSWLNVAEFGVFKSFGAEGFIDPRVSSMQKERALALCDDVLATIASKRDVEKLCLQGVWIGDLIYDSFLMSQRQPTIDLTSPHFKKFLLDSIELFVFWLEYFDSHDVRGVNVSHCVYNLAIPLRIAVQRGIPAFQAGITHIYRLSQDNLFAYNDFHYFPTTFRLLPNDVRLAGVADAQCRIQRRFAGEVGVDMAYSTKSAYGATRHERLLRESTRTKILIASHCFFDSPHSYGNNLFPDFYEWLEFLGEMSQLTDYDWYIKTHPDFLPGNAKVIGELIARYPKFTLLPSDASHHQIIAEGINVALTTYGTIGFEYAALGVPVINASLNNPHVAYGFNVHAQSVEHYRELLLGLDQLEFTIDPSQVYEYYFMRFIYNTENLFFEDYEKTISELGGYAKQFSPGVYDSWLGDWSIHKHAMLLSAMDEFIVSGDFRMNHTHYGREYTC